MLQYIMLCVEITHPLLFHRQCPPSVTVWSKPCMIMDLMKLFKGSKPIELHCMLIKGMINMHTYKGTRDNVI